MRPVNTRSNDPWETPGCSLEVTGRIPSWNLLQKGEGDESLQTPALPASINDISSPERLSLVPSGCTHLRLTVFPKVPLA